MKRFEGGGFRRTLSDKMKCFVNTAPDVEICESVLETTNIVVRCQTGFIINGRIRCSSDPLDFSRFCELNGFHGATNRTGEEHLTSSFRSHASLQHLQTRSSTQHNRIHACGRCFYPKRLELHCFITSCIHWETKPN